MTGLTSDAKLAVRRESEAVAREYIQNEHSRGRTGFKWLVGINAGVVLTLIISSLTFLQAIVRNQVITAVDRESRVLSQRVENMNKTIDSTLTGAGKFQRRKDQLELQADELDSRFIEATTNIEERGKKFKETLEKLSGLEDAQLIAISKWMEDEGKGVISELKQATESVNQLHVFQTRTLPIGSIIGWHATPEDVNIPKDLVGANKPWMRCDGELVTDADSPFHKKRLPNLNGDGRFLRGGENSGMLQSEQVGPHLHKINLFQVGADMQAGGRSQYLNPNTKPGEYFETRDNEIPPGESKETRPVNMSVVWIIRVK